MRHVLEGFLWDSVRAFLVPDDILCMRTTARKCNVAGLHVRASCRTLLFLHEDLKNGPLPPPERPGMSYDYRKLFGFDREEPLS